MSEAKDIGSGEDEILFHHQDHAGIITLNRPRALNALNLNMVRRMDRQLRDWADDGAVRHVIIQATPGRAFCAGGDIRAIYDWKKENNPDLLAFYYEEYRLNHMIKRYAKPYIALIDGIVMGGGVGLSVHGQARIIGNNALFAMPETGIGFFPDVGGSYFLPRCPGQSGFYLGLTGARIKSADMLWAGIATHHVSSDVLSGLCDRLAAAENVDGVIASLGKSAHQKSELSDVSGEIDDVFSRLTMAEILAALDASGSEFAQNTAKTLAAKAPASLCVVLRQLREGGDLSFEDCMAMEYRLVSRFVDEHDLFEGIRAVVVEKDGAPKWRPGNLGAVTAAMVDSYFAPLENELVFGD